MRLTSEEYRAWQNKRITLVGMSGVGKTHLSKVLRQHDWFHYAGDYRIGKRYLNEAILDLIKEQAMQQPFIRDLLRKDWIAIKNNIQIDDPGPILSYIGKVGNPDLGGVPLDQFVERQERYRIGEIEAMRDVPSFIDKAQRVYGYAHFVNDVGGSLCELDEPGLLELLAEHTLVLYIKTTTDVEVDKLIHRAQSDPKPLLYRPEFLKENLAKYLEEHDLSFAAQMDPDDFARWVFPRLFREREPRYEAIANEYGYTVTSEAVSKVTTEADFNRLVEQAIQEQA